MILVLDRQELHMVTSCELAAKPKQRLVITIEIGEENTVCLTLFPVYCYHLGFFAVGLHV